MSDAVEERLLLIVEDDEAFARTLSRSFERRGYRVLHADSLESAQGLLADHDPGYAVVDLKLKGDSSGLACVQALHQHDDQMLIYSLPYLTRCFSSLRASVRRCIPKRRAVSEILNPVSARVS